MQVAPGLVWPAMTAVDPPHAGVLRPPSQVMRLDRLGALEPFRLSFARQLLRRIAAGTWSVERRLWSIDAKGAGVAVLVARAGARRYGLVARCGHAEAGPDIGLVLFDGEPGLAEIARIVAALGQPSSARLTARDLCLAEARRDEVLWPHAVARLAAGAGPDAATVAARGGLIWVRRLVASGKAGTADRELIADRPDLHPPFQVELLTLWLARVLARELVVHVAAADATQAVQLAPAAAAALGIGLEAGLGLAAFPVTHPCLFNTWVMAREQAIARVLALDRVEGADWARVAARNAARGNEGAGHLAARMAQGPAGRRPWAELMRWAETALPPSAQEGLASSLLEPYGALVDGLGHCMADRLDREYRIDGSMSVGRVRELIAQVHGWALERDWTAMSMTALAWSMTGEEEEPRLGARRADPTGPFELPLAVVHDAVRAWRALGLHADEMPVAQVLLDHPEHRSAIRRAQIAGFAPYAEIRENLIDADVRPVLLIRAMLAYLGADVVAVRDACRIGAGFFAGTPCPTAEGAGT